MQQEPPQEHASSDTAADHLNTQAEASSSSQTVHQEKNSPPNSVIATAQVHAHNAAHDISLASVEEQVEDLENAAMDNRDNHPPVSTNSTNHLN